MQICVVSLSTVGSLVDHRAYKPYTLAGQPILRQVLAPLAVNSSTTDYVYLYECMKVLVSSARFPTLFTFSTAPPAS